jgi:hypothetical protein
VNGLVDAADGTAPVSVSFCEIYCDRIRDLGKAYTSRDKRGGSREEAMAGARTSDLYVRAANERHGIAATDPNSIAALYAADNLEIREDAKGRVFVKDLVVVPVSSVTEVMSIVEHGFKLRATHETKSNATSSRSHTIFTFHLRRRSASTGSVTASQLHLVDLGGSERITKSESTGQRLAEAQSINLSLTCLGKVVTALSNPAAMTGAHVTAATATGDRSASHVPYRDSKLTRMLQNSLGGAAYTALVATVHPQAADVEETLCTLHFATRCQTVMNRVRALYGAVVVVVIAGVSFSAELLWLGGLPATALTPLAPQRTTRARPPRTNARTATHQLRVFQRRGRGHAHPAAGDHAERGPSRRHQGEAHGRHARHAAHGGGGHQRLSECTHSCGNTRACACNVRWKLCAAVMWACLRRSPCVTRALQATSRAPPMQPRHLQLLPDGRFRTSDGIVLGVPTHEASSSPFVIRALALIAPEPSEDDLSRVRPVPNGASAPLPDAPHPTPEQLLFADDAVNVEQALGIALACMATADGVIGGAAPTTMADLWPHTYDAASGADHGNLADQHSRSGSPTALQSLPSVRGAELPTPTGAVALVRPAARPASASLRSPSLAGSDRAGAAGARGLFAAAATGSSHVSYKVLPDGVAAPSSFSGPSFTAHALESTASLGADSEPPHTHAHAHAHSHTHHNGLHDSHGSHGDHTHYTHYHGHSPAGQHRAGSPRRGCVHCNNRSKALSSASTEGPVASSHTPHAANKVVAKVKNSLAITHRQLHSCQLERVGGGGAGMDGDGSAWVDHAAEVARLKARIEELKTEVQVGRDEAVEQARWLGAQVKARTEEASVARHEAAAARSAAQAALTHQQQRHDAEVSALRAGSVRLDGDVRDALARAAPPKEGGIRAVALATRTFTADMHATREGYAAAVAHLHATHATQLEKLRADAEARLAAAHARNEAVIRQLKDKSAARKARIAELEAQIGILKERVAAAQAGATASVGAVAAAPPAAAPLTAPLVAPSVAAFLQKPPRLHAPASPLGTASAHLLLPTKRDGSQARLPVPWPRPGSSGGSTASSSGGGHGGGGGGGGGGLESVGSRTSAARDALRAESHTDTDADGAASVRESPEIAELEELLARDARLAQRGVPEPEGRARVAALLSRVGSGTVDSAASGPRRL